jgi:trimeric autotransporter adhesin
MKVRVGIGVVLTLVLCAFGQAQQSVATNTKAPVPPLMNFSGVLTTVSGKPLTEITGVTFYLYKDQQGGAPLWMETQNVQPDDNGHYTVLLGSTKSDGLPTDLFASGQARWLAVQVQGQDEQPRILLLSVPYALKAADAETLGGMPASAFVQSNPAAAPTQSSFAATPAKATPQSNASLAESAAISGTGTTNFIPLWVSSTALGSSLIYQSNGMLGVGTQAPKSTIDVHSTTTAVSGTSTGAGKAGVYGLAAGIGVQGIGNSTTSTGVSGIGAQYGVNGTAGNDQPNAAGVYGAETSATSTYPVYGVEGLVKTSQNGVGVYGLAQAIIGKTVGVKGVSSSSSGNGISGNATATTGSANGMFGQTASAGGAGGLFQNTSTGTGARILVAEDGSGTQRFSVDTHGNVNVITGTTTQVKGPLLPVNHARAIVDILQNQNYSVTLNWKFPFPDTSYTVSCSPMVPAGFQGAGNGVYLLQVTSLAMNTVQVEIAAIGTGDITIHCIGVHD